MQSDSSGRRRISLTISSTPAVLSQVSAAARPVPSSSINSEIPSSKGDIMKYLGQVKVGSCGRGIGTEESLEMGMPELEPIDAILSGNDAIRSTLPTS